MNSPLIICRVCGHTFADGRHCQGPVIRGRACCRHHLDARLHNMARAPEPALSNVERFARVLGALTRDTLAAESLFLLKTDN